MPQSIQSTDILLLSAPVQHTADNVSVECDPKRLKNWLESLPVEDVEKTVCELSAAIKPFNELRVEPRTRLRLLELYYGVLDTIIYTYDELHLRTLPISLEQRRILADDIMWLYLELANGYKSIVKLAHETGSSGLSAGEGQLGIYRAMELIANALIYAYRHHREAPPLAYLELHQLYYLGEQYEIEDTPLGAMVGGPGESSIANLYNQIMLLVAGNPYAVEGNRIFELFVLLRDFAPPCRLLAQGISKDAQAGFYVDFMEDRAPRGATQLNGEPLLPHQRIIDVAPAIDRMIDALKQQKTARVRTMTSEESRLLRLFVANVRRAATEELISADFGNDGRVAYGLDACCYYLQHQQSLLESTTEETAGIEVRDLDIFETENELSSWKVAAVGAHARLLLGQTDTQGEHYSVGELVTLVERVGTDPEPLIGAGFIRWVRHEDTQLRFAVELLRGLPMPVECALAGEDETAADIPPFQALYLPRDKGREQSASVIMEYSYFKHARQFRVSVQGHQYCIEPVRIFTETPLYIQFSFRVIR